MVAQMRPLPELLRRDDVELHKDHEFYREGNGEWDVTACAAERGSPFTAIVRREMNVPLGDDDTSRAIRAHEMMHAKVSTGDREPWVLRGRATDEGMQSAEEIRVNYLASKAGFNMKNVVDLNDTSVGEQLATAENWAECVYYVGACLYTGSLNKFIVGVRRINPEWADSLRALAKRLQKSVAKMDKNSNGDFRSTKPWPKKNPIGTIGYTYTEDIAEFLDRIANPPAPPEDDTDQPWEPEPVVVVHVVVGNGDTVAEDNKPAPKMNVEQIAKIKMDRESKGRKGRYGDGPNETPSKWEELRFADTDLNRHVPGAIARRRVATNRGKNPRRIKRLLVDPHRRVFDRNIKHAGGVVLIDVSGSMHITADQVKAILEASPGATVIAHGENGHKINDDNMFVLGKGNRMVTDLPSFRGMTNANDRLAIQYAVDLKEASKVPVIWITDGLTHDKQGGYYVNESAQMECIKVVLRENVLLASNADEAITVLKDLGKGRRNRRHFPRAWRTAYRHRVGKELR